MGPQGITGLQGPPGVQGPTGLTGAAGPAGAAAAVTGVSILAFIMAAGCIVLIILAKLKKWIFG